MIIVDRVLNDIAICIKDGVQIDIPLSNIDGQVGEKDILCFDEISTMYSVQAEETKKREDAISVRFARIKNQHKKEQTE